MLSCVHKGDNMSNPGSRFCPDVAVIDKDVLHHTWNHTNFVIGRTADFDEKCIVFNTLGFILNDQGKTIEKIPAINDYPEYHKNDIRDKYHLE